MDTQAELVRDRSKQASVLKIIDCDVHPTVRGGIASIYPYMPEAWSRRFIRKNASQFHVDPERIDVTGGSAGGSGTSSGKTCCSDSPASRRSN